MSRTNVLRINEMPDGLWTGRMLVDGLDVGGFSNLASSLDVELTACDCGFADFHIERQEDADLPHVSTTELA